VTDLKIVVDDLSGPAIAALLQEHLNEMRATSPPESTHALDLDGLRSPDVTFWSALAGDEVAGCAALKRLDAEHGELKSMRTARAYTRRGVAGLLLAHVLAEAEAAGIRRISLETGSFPFFDPARRLYEKFGFEYCPPFGSYIEDPNSVFMTRAL
jgi:putative acetyltransferase